MKNLLFSLKAVQTGGYNAEVGAGAGAETNSFGSATVTLAIFTPHGLFYFLPLCTNLPSLLSIYPLLIVYLSVSINLSFLHHISLSIAGLTSPLPGSGREYIQNTYPCRIYFPGGGTP
jgi:hypothetical protein